MKFLSTREAATRLGLSQARVQDLIQQGILPAQRIGRAYVVDEAHLSLPTVQARRKPGRPRQK